MILKPRKKPLPLQKLELAIPRLSTTFPKIQLMKEDLARRMKGYIGEKHVDNHLEELSKSATFLSNVTLKQNNKIFEMDTILITNQAVYIIDCKNYLGTITFDTHFKQLIRTEDESETGFRYPITQVQTQKQKLKQWFATHDFGNIPIHYFIAISDPSTVIKVNGDPTSVAEVVSHGENIPNMITKIDRQIQDKKKPPLNHTQIGTYLLKKSHEYDRDILREYNIETKDLKPGVICPTCKFLGMSRIHSKWLCPQCHHTSKHAHHTTLKAYFLLIQPYITNKICRYWLKINSRNTATRLLQTSNLTYNRKHKIWLPKNIT